MPLDTVDRATVLSKVHILIEGDANARALSSAGAQISLSLGMRYLGQGYEVDVNVPDLENCDAASIREAFLREYHRVFGLTFPDHVIEIFNWTVQLAQSNKLSDVSKYRFSNAGTASQKATAGRLVGGEDEAIRIAVLNRYALRPGDVIDGGTLVEENDTTIYVPHFAQGIVTPSFDILATVQPRR
jgi:N-methylhydantoinase A/oxoprolinase/acetone carboxylase beta subunit